MTFAPFTVTKVERHDQAELFDRLRQVVMLKDPLARPYAQAELSLRRLDWDEFRPAQRYVLSDNLHKIQHLEWELARFGLDPLALDGFLTLWTDVSDEPLDLLPPVVELVVEADGSAVNVVNDGMHRLFVGRLEWKRPVAIHVQGLPAEFPYYSYPVPGPRPWDEVKIVEGGAVPAGLIKKWRRIPDDKRLYRNFNSAFRNVGGPRGQG
ncbi:MAG: hypothetical protein LBU12_05250 [Deltaproteobacteria bacterium]|jgi:hypothetical protein|nr:hypothetical protein [Deltaproteobacteria bacterium]